MGSNDLPFRREATKGWNSNKDDKTQRLAAAADTAQSMAFEREQAIGGSKRNEEQKEIARLKSELKKANRRAEGFRKKYNVTFNQWWDEVSDRWRLRGLVPPNIEEALKRIKEQWEAQQIEVE